MKCLLVAAVVLSAAVVSGSSCPLESVKASVYNQNQDYQGTETPFKWYFSPCTPSNAPSLPVGCAGGPGFLQEYDATGTNGGACQMSLSTQTSAWQLLTSADGSRGYTASFANTANLRTATINVKCNPEASAGVNPVGNAQATSPSPGLFHWVITLESANACGDATQAPITTMAPLTVAPSAGGCPLSGVQPTVWEQTQSFQGKENDYVWFLDPCHISTASGYPNCAEGSGYFQEFNTKSNGAACQMSLGKMISGWTEFVNSSGSPGYKAYFENPSGYRKAEIDIMCDINAPDGVAPIGDVEVTDVNSNGEFHFHLTLKSRQACALTPTVGPITAAPPASTCPLSAITPQSYSQNQLFQGTTSPFKWFFSPCEKKDAPNAGTCSGGAGYLQEFSSSSMEQCQMSLDTIVVGWMKGTVNGSVSYNTNLVNRAGDRTAQVFVVCDSSAGNLEPVGDAVAHQTNSPGSFIWEITLKSSKICEGHTTVPPSTTSSPSTSSPSSSDCSAYSEKGCTACTTSPSGRCGYCLETKSCDEGTSNGPLKGSCPTSLWQWYPTQCQ